jgi:hypothetical protein
MAFHSQLGRFGDVAQALTGMADFDQRAANIIAQNGIIAGTIIGTITGPGRPNLFNILGLKGFWEPSDPTWTTWLPFFNGHLGTYKGHGGVALKASCPRSPPGFPTGFCLHELAPPLNHGNPRWFSTLVRGIADNIQTRADGSVGVDPSSRPIWNFIINEVGEIVISSEDFEAIKHTCIAAGADVWSAGQIGIKGGVINLVDLQSGHYVRPNVGQGTSHANALIAFTTVIFKDYCAHFGIRCLDPGFTCIWG